MKTIIDWCSFRTQADIPACLEALRAIYYPMGELLTVQHRKGGWMGYKQAADLCMGDMHLGLIAYGGEVQRGWVTVNLTGRGCEWVQDWARADSLLRLLPRFELRRVDIALTTYRNEVHHDMVVAAHSSGQFSTGGKPPLMSMITSSDPMAGKTIYIGARGSGKLLRCYEKGLEMVKSKVAGLHVTTVKIEGLGHVPVLDVYRVELELKAKNGALPLDLIDRRDHYFAGAYPFTETLLAVDPQTFSQSREAGPQRDLHMALQNIKHQYGKTIFTAFMAYGGNVSAVIDQIMGAEHSEALLSAGVMLVEHDVE